MVYAHDCGQGDPWEVVALCHKLGADKDLALTSAKGSKNPLVCSTTLSGVCIHARDPHPGEDSLYGFFDTFGSVAKNAHFSIARRTILFVVSSEAAVMTPEPTLPLMQDETAYAAGGARIIGATAGTLDNRCVPPTIVEHDGLLAGSSGLFKCNNEGV
jgi:hypothetical protein